MPRLRLFNAESPQPKEGGSAAFRGAGRATSFRRRILTSRQVSEALKLTVLLPATLLLGCGETKPAPASPGQAGEATVWFVEEAAARGLDFVHRSGQGERYLYPEIVCGGGALFDMDGDGDLDVYLVQSDGVLTPRAQRRGNRLYENRGDGTFVDVTDGSGADDKGYGIGVATADYDGDGDVDLYVTNLEENALLRNEGGGKFVDVTQQAGVSEPLWSSSAAFLDYDRDGDLDLFVVNYILWSLESERTCYAQPHGETYCGPLAYEKPAPDTLFRNEGDGTFTNVSNETGIRGELGNGLGVGVSDFDGDGWLDLFVANDGTKDHAWINKGGSRFVERAVALGCAADQDGRIKAGMGVALYDLDDDADEDLLVVNLTGEYDSYFQNERTHFVDRTASVGLTIASQAFTRFGVGFHDFDQDGRVDLYEANGRVAHGSTFPGDDPFVEENLVYRGTEKGRFRALSPFGGTDVPVLATSRGAAFGDVDGDGAIDVLVINRDDPVHLFMNRAATGNWTRLRVEDGARSAEGAELLVTVGERTFLRRVRSSTSYCTASDPRVHVGLGAATGIDQVVVRWTDGAREAFGPRTAGEEHVLTRGGGEPR